MRPCLASRMGQRLERADRGPGAVSSASAAGAGCLARTCERCGRLPRGEHLAARRAPTWWECTGGCAQAGALGDSLRGEAGTAGRFLPVWGNLAAITTTQRTVTGRAERLVCALVVRAEPRACRAGAGPWGACPSPRAATAGAWSPPTAGGWPGHTPRADPSRMRPARRLPAGANDPDPAPEMPGLKRIWGSDSRARNPLCDHGPDRAPGPAYRVGRRGRRLALPAPPSPDRPRHVALRSAARPDDHADRRPVPAAVVG